MSASPTSIFSHQSFSESGCSHASTILPTRMSSLPNVGGSSDAAAHGGWEVGHTPEGVAYYYNTATQATQWNVPAERSKPE